MKRGVAQQPILRRTKTWVHAYKYGIDIRAYRYDI
jgi:hypothetical protein